MPYKDLEKKKRYCREYYYKYRGSVRKTIRDNSDEQTKIINKYLDEKCSLKELSRLFNYDKRTIRKFLISKQIEIKNQLSNDERQRWNKSLKKYSCDEDFFNTSSPNRDYVLGMFFSDGTISKNRNKHKFISLGLNKRDEYLVKIILSELKANNPVAYNADMVSFTLYSKKLYDMLFSLGCVRNKSFINDVDFRDEDILFPSHFLRGLIDGDGSIFTSKNGTFNVSLCNSSVILLNHINDIVYKYLGISRPIYNYKYMVPFITWHNADAIKICSWIYQHSNDLFMIRKYQKFIGYVESKFKISYYINLAEVVSLRSKCKKHKYGCVITKNDRVISTGYNGHPRNTCEDDTCLRLNIAHGKDTHVGYCCHAEINAIIFSSMYDRENATIFITGAPCSYCSRYLIQSGIKNIIFVDDNFYEGVELSRSLKSDLTFIPIKKEYLILNKDVIGEEELSRE